jgi:hypothetical protein
MAILDLSRPPAPWSIVEGETPRDDVLLIGRRRVRLGDIAAARAASVAELNYDGHMLAVGMFMGIGCLFALAVATTIASPRFLAGTIVFVGIGLMLIADIRQGHAMTVHRVVLRLCDGTSEIFATTDTAEASRLIAELEARTGLSVGADHGLPSAA